MKLSVLLCWAIFRSLHDISTCIKGDLPSLLIEHKSSSNQAMKRTMRRLTSCVILSLFLLSQISSGAADLSKDNAADISDAMSNTYIRKVLAEISLDYQDAGANNKHDSQRGKPGIGFRIP